MSLTEISGHRKFTLQEANEMIPLFESITRKHEGNVSKALKDQTWLMKSGAPPAKVIEVDNYISSQLAEWGKKMFKLGASVFSGGYIGLDSGSFFYSWHLGDKEIKYFHYYFEYPGSRRSLTELQVIEVPVANKETT